MDLRPGLRPSSLTCLFTDESDAVEAIAGAGWVSKSAFRKGLRVASVQRRLFQFLGGSPDASL